MAHLLTLSVARTTNKHKFARQEYYNSLTLLIVNFLI
jgi:hypothetical protein